MILDFSRQIFEKHLNLNLTKIRPVGAEPFHAGGRTRDEADSRFPQVC